MLGWVAGLRLTGRDEYALRSCVAVEWSGGRAVVVGSCVDMELAIVGSVLPNLDESAGVSHDISQNAL
jgi:hypothetical protein